MKRLLVLPVLLTLISCGSTTQVVSPRISDELRRECGDLPKLRVEAGTDMRQALLQNRAESEAVHATCKARHQGVLRAVGSSPIKTAPGPDRWAEFLENLK